MNLDHIDWNGAYDSIHEKGFAILKSSLDKRRMRRGHSHV